MRMNIVPTERSEWPPPYREATEKYSAQVRLPPTAPLRITSQNSLFRCSIPTIRRLPSRLSGISASGRASHLPPIGRRQQQYRFSSRHRRLESVVLVERRLRSV